MADSPGPERETRIAMRATRRDILTQRDAPRFEAIIMQRALEEPLADSTTMVDQLRHLEKLAELPNVTLRVLPAALSRWTPAHSGQFMVFTYPKAEPIVHLEHLHAAAFLSGDATVQAHQQALDTLRDAALSSEVSTEFIAACATETEENTP